MLVRQSWGAHARTRVGRALRAARAIMASRDAEQNVTLATDATSYLEEKGIDALLKSLLSEVMKNRPADPLQFMIDSLSMDPLHARQDVNGLSQYRANKLRKVFSSLDKDGSGAIDFKEISLHANRYGGTALREDDLREGETRARTRAISADSRPREHASASGIAHKMETPSCACDRHALIEGRARGLATTLFANTSCARARVHVSVRLTHSETFP